MEKSNASDLLVFILVAFIGLQLLKGRQDTGSSSELQSTNGR